MEMKAEDLYEVLKTKGIDSLNHANSVLTSCQFLRSGALISRGTIEKKKWRQTQQKSDVLDKDFGIWNDIFVDSVDIHDRAKCANSYGPVLIKIDSSILKNGHVGNVWVTKSNPIYWDHKSVEGRWFQSIDEFAKEFIEETFCQMIVFRNYGDKLPIKKYVKEILLDNPVFERKLKYDPYSLAYGALRYSLEEGGIEGVPIQKRICKSSCTCTEDYNDDLKGMARMYAPWGLKNN